jgi:poly(A) polymerase
MGRVNLPQGPGVAAVVSALGGAARFVGGCVRDVLAGQTAKDVDLATPLLPEAVVARLEAAGIKAIPTGIAHGTITAVALGEVVEVTTLRRDVATDGRRATIAYTSDWQEDAARRDFTINALYADPATGALFDWFGGVDDLAAGIVRFIGAPLERIAEDHLRILRFFRFYARFGEGAPHAESLAACNARANDLMALSRERIAMELLAILALPDPAPVIALMIEQGILVPVLPEIDDAAPLAALIAQEQAQAIAPDPLRRLAALLPADPKRAEEIGQRLKLSNAQKKRLIAAASRLPADTTAPRALAYWIGVDEAIDRLLLLGSPDAANLTGWTPPLFPLSGGAIVARGIKAGPDVARILQTVERQWVDEGFPEGARIEAILAGVLG